VSLNSQGWEAAREGGEHGTLTLGPTFPPLVYSAGLKIDGGKEGGMEGGMEGGIEGGRSNLSQFLTALGGEPQQQQQQQYDKHLYQQQLLTGTETGQERGKKRGREGGVEEGREGGTGQRLVSRAS